MINTSTEKNNNEKNLVLILRSMVCYHKKSISIEGDWNALWNIARYNHLEVILYLAAKANKESVPEELYSKMQKKYYEITARDAKQITNVMNMII